MDECKCVRAVETCVEVEEPQRNVWRKGGSGVGAQHESGRLHSRRQTKESVLVLEELENDM